MERIVGKEPQVTDEIKIVFLGDSITDDGTFIAYMDAYFHQYVSGSKNTFINLGVSSETASGLTEPDHPFTRPCIHERLGRALQESKPDWVVLGYGMNDGIYSPFSEERLCAYQKGILEAIRLIQQSGAKAIVMTPPPFDPESLQADVLRPYGQEAYSYIAPYVLYNNVLRIYANWILTLDTTADKVVNIYDPILQSREYARKMNPAYRSGDGIHPNSEGHWMIAKTLLNRLFNITLERVPDYVQKPETSPLFQLLMERHKLLSSAWKEHVGHTNPNKSVALPLETALQRSEEMTKQIRKMAVLDT